MTRDEAVKKAAGYDEYNARDVVNVERFVDRLTRLGLLKLDDTKTPEQLALDVFTEESNSRNLAEDLLDSLHKAGLKVVRA